jgi:flavin reductase (DIM6/NTAB) family NADH-FMN oxidoreductase RutF
MEFETSLTGCVIANGNSLFRRSKECVINVPGRKINKFETFRLTPNPAQVKAPLIRECHANFE